MIMCCCEDSIEVDSVSPLFSEKPLAPCAVFIEECCSTTCCDKPKVSKEVLIGLLTTFETTGTRDGMKARPVDCELYDYTFELCPCIPEDASFTSMTDVQDFAAEWCDSLLFGDSFDESPTEAEQMAFNNCVEYFGPCCDFKILKSNLN
mmetsp:Transcript_8395/g.16229  ORF Transcript_8395/g.16229 Transcript_8395/m.16229 type:complete len:149 (+) Transcript_8395:2-448(+)